MESVDTAVSQGFLIGGMVAIVVLAVLWFVSLRKRAINPYPIVPMLSVAFIAQAIGLVAFLN